VSRAGTRRFRPLAVALPIFLLIAAACGDGTGPVPADASFTYEVTGDIVRHVEGDEAHFATVTDPDLGQVWELELAAGTNNELGSVVFLFRAGRPGPGMYSLSGADVPPLIPPRGIGVFFALEPAVPSDAFLGSAVSGTATIEAGEPGTVSGSFQLAADGNLFRPGEFAVPGELTMTGTFTTTPSL